MTEVTLVDGGVTVTFRDAVVPPLPAGDYVIEVEQSISGDGVTGSFRHDQAMRVTGPHFGLAPGDVFSVHPPRGSHADWSDELPSVVLSRPGLPWQIAIADRPTQASGQPAGFGAPAPWLAVLLLTPEEILPAASAVPNPTGAQQIPLVDYLIPPAGTAGPHFTAAQIARFREEHAADFTVTAVDVDAAAFAQSAPALDETRLLAHTRDVADAELAVLQGTAQSAADPQAAGSYAVVAGNRLIRGSATGVYIAHLVSLEGFAAMLPPAAPPAGRVRLLSLESWTFTSEALERGFAETMRNLTAGPLRMPAALGPDSPDAPEAAGAHEAAEPDPDRVEALVARALDLGYTAAEYLTRLGERTVAWYRGPLLPVPMKPNPQPPYRSAEAALIYDSSTGMFDVSFAVAWQTGRLLTLADREVSTELARWLRGHRRALNLLLGRDRLRASHPVLGLPHAPRALLSAAGPAAARALLVGELAPGAARPALWGPAIDPTGLHPHLTRLPGLIAPADLPGALAGPGDPARALLSAARARAAAPQTPAAADDGEPGRSADVPGLGVAAPGPGPAHAPIAPQDLRPHQCEPRRSRALRALTADPRAAEAVAAGEPLPEAVRLFLERIALLHDLPFDTLVPDSRALPPEALRFAVLDENWAAALADGALSVAAVEEPDDAVLDLLRPAVRRAAETPVTGFLLRSTAVSDWPGLRIRVFEDHAATRPLRPLRVDRLSPTLLLALFAGRVGRLDLAPPAQGVGFGVQPGSGAATGRGGHLRVRGLGGEHTSGEPISGATATVPLRPATAPEREVIDVTALHAVLLDVLAAYYPDGAPAVGPGAFGLELISGGDVQLFLNQDGQDNQDGLDAAGAR